MSLGMMIYPKFCFSLAYYFNPLHAFVQGELQVQEYNLSQRYSDKQKSHHIEALNSINYQEKYSAFPNWFFIHNIQILNVQDNHFAQSVDT
jgi:hypothetical protein